MKRRKHSRLSFLCILLMIMSICFICGCGRKTVVITASDFATESTGSSGTVSSSGITGSSGTVSSSGYQETSDSAQNKNTQEEEEPTSSADTVNTANPAATVNTANVSATSSGVTGAGTEQKAQIIVFVCGAVNKPGVYHLDEYSRASDALEAAGGFTEDADPEWCNLAQMLEDGQRLRIYTRKETAELESDGYMEDDSAYAEGGQLSSSGENVSSKVNLNTADKEELTTLPGIGSARADAIISYRRQHGGFTSIEEILQISGIKNSVYNNIKDLIIV